MTAARTVDREGEYFEWRFGTIHYTFVTGENPGGENPGGEKGPPLLMVPGFGVGSWHFSNNMEEVARATGRDVYALDILGQGRSWPAPYGDEGVKCAATGERLRYSCDVWVGMIRDFLAGVVGGPAVLVGNSLGGYLCAHAASQHPDMVAGVVLLNATPFWGFVRGESDLLWDGYVPAPAAIRGPIEKLWWDNLRKEATVKSLLRLVYARPEKAECPVMVQGILRPTGHPHAVDAFASIAFSPVPRASFNDALGALRCPVLLLYGKEDPWVVPLWGQRAHRVLSQTNADVEYLELSPAGHCPHHEAPAAVNAALTGWLARQSGVAGSVELSSGETSVRDGVSITKVDGSPRNAFEWFDWLRWRATGTV